MTEANQTRLSRDRMGSSRWPAFLWRRNIVTDIVQGVIGIMVGAVLAFITFAVIAHSYGVKVNGWTTMYGCGEPGTGILQRGACALTFPGPINVPQEAVYWRTTVDSAGQKLSGQHDYILHF